jgi:UDP-glucose 4-epimerase
MDKQRILITGGAGYLGSVAAHHLKNLGFELLIVDDLSTGHAKACGTVPLARISITDAEAMKKTIAGFKPDCIVHLAAISDIGACARNPERAREVNIEATASILQFMQVSGCKALVFASSAAVYASKDTALSEHDPLGANSVYGNSKIKAEEIIRAATGLKPVILRFFNIAGADTAANLGECHEPETHLIPNTLQALVSEKTISLFGTDYPTPDGTAVRDYVHVLDAADAIHKAILYAIEHTGGKVFNVGSGVARSVLEVVNQAAVMAQKQPRIDYQTRREGDATCLLADCSAIAQTLGWSAKHSSLEEIINSALDWHNRKAIAA